MLHYYELTNNYGFVPRPYPYLAPAGSIMCSSYFCRDSVIQAIVDLKQQPGPAMLMFSNMYIIICLNLGTSLNVDLTYGQSYLVHYSNLSCIPIPPWTF